MSEESDIIPCKSVLVVEDDQSIRDLLKIALELDGYEVSTAENGQIALDLLPQMPKPCLILLDLMMPVMDGWAFAAKLEKDVVLATIPVVIVSAFSDKGKDIKAKAFIKKPVDLEALFLVVKKWCPPKNRKNNV